MPAQDNARIAERTEEFESSDHLYGMASINKALEPVVEFPANRVDLIQQVGKAHINWTRTEDMFLEDILREIHQDNFDSQEELTDAILSVIHMAYGDRGVENQEKIVEESQ